MKVSEAVLKEGAALFACDPDTLKFMERGGAPDGAVFERTTDTEHLFVKFVPTKEDELTAVQEKYAFVNYLSENGLGVPTLLSSIQGRQVEFIEAEGQWYAVSKMAKSPGHHIGREDWNESFFELWGRALGRLHALSKRYEGGKHIGSWRGEHAFFAKTCSDEAVLEKWKLLREDLEQLPEPPDAFGLIHNDLGVWNLLLDGSKITLLDFEVCDHHWFAHDIAIALVHPIWGMRNKPRDEIVEFAQHFKESLLKGYLSENHLDDFWLKQLPLFGRYRHMLSYIAFTDLAGPEVEEWQKAESKDLRESILADASIVGLDV